MLSTGIWHRNCLIWDVFPQSSLGRPYAQALNLAQICQPRIALFNAPYINGNCYGNHIIAIFLMTQTVTHTYGVNASPDKDQGSINV